MNNNRANQLTQRYNQLIHSYNSPHNTDVNRRMILERMAAINAELAEIDMNEEHDDTEIWNAEDIV